jgi:hypothetical protein
VGFEPQQDLYLQPGRREVVSSGTPLSENPETAGLCSESHSKLGRVLWFLCSSPTLSITVISLLCLELRVCQDLNCPPNSQCSKEVPTCRCLPGYTKEGSKCQGEPVSWRLGTPAQGWSRNREACSPQLWPPLWKL